MKLIIIKIVICLVVSQHITLAMEDTLQKFKHFNLSAGTGYSFHLTNSVKSPVNTINGGLTFSCNVDYFFNELLGISLESGRSIIYKNEIADSKAALTSVPIILSASIFSNRFKFQFGAGINFCTSEINSSGLISQSNYIDITYSVAIGYYISLVSNLYLTPVIELNYSSDLKLGRIVPLVQFGIRF